MINVPITHIILCDFTILYKLVQAAVKVCWVFLCIFIWRLVEANEMRLMPAWTGCAYIQIPMIP